MTEFGSDASQDTSSEPEFKLRMFLEKTDSWNIGRWILCLSQIYLLKIFQDIFSLKSEL